MGDGSNTVCDCVCAECRADKRMPTLSLNSRRKFFHGLAVVMFIPGIAIDVSVALLS